VTKTITERDVARLVIDAGAVVIDARMPFTWSSGLQAPLYCDHRLLVAQRDVRRQISQALAALIRDSIPAADAVAGVALAAVPWAAWVADLLNLPLLIVRRERKGHGHGRQVEGALNGICSVVVLEDVVSTGRSVIRVVEALRASGLCVENVASILDYQISGNTLERQALRLRALYTYESLRGELEVRGFNRESLAALDTWYSKLDSGDWRRH
jgi:orotate phosphoribosyltransferase